MNPPVIHVVTPASSSGTLWAEVQRLQGVEAESARTIAHLNQSHREVSEMQQARIEELEEALDKIADHRTQLPWSECCRIARAALGPANLQETDTQKALEEVRQLKEEIATLEWMRRKQLAGIVEMQTSITNPLDTTKVIWLWTWPERVRDAARIGRSVSRLESMLPANTAGMKPEVP